MVNKSLLIDKLKESDPQLSSTIERWNETYGLQGDWKISEETAFFAQILDMFSDDPELPVEQLRSFPCHVIVDYLTKTHRYYLNKRLPEIEQQLTQLSTLPGELSTTLASVLSWLQKNMEKHFRVEEQSLFPYIETLEKAKNKEISMEKIKATFKDFTVQRFIETHHDEVENKLAEIKKYIVRCLSTMDELFPYKVLLLKLDALEKDLRLHARVEDEVLVPMALDWEKEIG